MSYQRREVLQRRKGSKKRGQEVKVKFLLYAEYRLIYMYIYIYLCIYVCVYIKHVYGSPFSGVTDHSLTKAKGAEVASRVQTALSMM